MACSTPHQASATHEIEINRATLAGRIRQVANIQRIAAGFFGQALPGPFDPSAPTLS